MLNRSAPKFNRFVPGACFTLSTSLVKFGNVVMAANTHTDTTNQIIIIFYDSLHVFFSSGNNQHRERWVSVRCASESVCPPPLWDVTTGNVCRGSNADWRHISIRWVSVFRGGSDALVRYALYSNGIIAQMVWSSGRMAHSTVEVHFKVEIWGF